MQTAPTPLLVEWLNIEGDIRKYTYASGEDEAAEKQEDARECCKQRFSRAQRVRKAVDECVENRIHHSELFDSVH